MVVSGGGEESGDLSNDTTRIAVDTSQDKGPSEASLVVIQGPEIGRRYPIDRPVVDLGRGSDNLIRIPSDDASRHHARVLERDGQQWIEDLDSTNGTLVNDERIERSPLVHGDIVRIGSALLKYICGGDPEALYHEEVSQMAITDGLTGLRNRRYLFECLDAEVARAVRHTRPLALGLFDIDEFKQINDQHGHLAGDYILRTLPAELSSMLRKEALLARFGGDEFAVLLPETDMEGARIFGERLRQRVENMAFDFEGVRIQITISMGIAALPLDPLEEGTTLFKKADDVLYAAKGEGRNTLRTTAD